jgi:hypothetical protein
MLRLRYLATGLIICLTSCVAAEKQLIDRFLQAVQAEDKDIVSAMSLASFPGKVESWEILEIGPTSTEAFRLEELEKEAAETRKALDAEVQKNDAFLKENEKTYLQYKARIDKDAEYKFPRGPLAAFQEEWEARLKKQKEMEVKAREALAAFKEEQEAVRKSTNLGASATYAGDVSVKTVRVNVKGGEGPKTYRFTLRRYNLVDTERNIKPIPNWLIAGIEEQGS